MRQGKVYKNEQGRFQLENDSWYWTSGDVMQIYDEELKQWLDGRVEHNGDDYYWTDDECFIHLYNGMMVRVED